jgi:hypothetical protein
MTKDFARSLICMSLCFAAMSVCAQPRVYKWVDADGVVHFSDEPPKESEGVTAESLLLPSSAPPTGFYRATRNAPIEPTPETQTVAPASAPAQTRGPDCSSPSPIKRSGGDLYEFAEERPEPLTTEEIEALETVIKGMAYTWSGTDVGFACDGALGRPPSRAVTSEGRAANPVEFALDSTISSRDSNQRELLRIELENQRLQVNRVDATLMLLSDRALAFGYKERRGGAIAELYWRIELDGARAMNVERTMYINGALGEFSIWELRKPY